MHLQGMKLIIVRTICLTWVAQYFETNRASSSRWLLSLIFFFWHLFTHFYNVILNFHLFWVIFINVDTMSCFCMLCLLSLIFYCHFFLSCMLFLFRRARFLSSASVLQDDGLKKGFVLLFEAWNLGGLRLKLKTTPHP